MLRPCFPMQNIQNIVPLQSGSSVELNFISKSPSCYATHLPPPPAASFFPLSLCPRVSSPTITTTTTPCCRLRLLYTNLSSVLPAVKKKDGRKKDRAVCEKRMFDQHVETELQRSCMSGRRKCFSCWCIIIHTYELSMLSIQKRINACGEMYCSCRTRGTKPEQK